MLTLYIKTGCPFCAVVVAKLNERGIEYKELNISDQKVAEELVARGGKRQVPYLVDTKNNTEMYESEDIVNYLDEHYGS